MSNLRKCNLHYFKINSFSIKATVVYLLWLWLNFLLWYYSPAAMKTNTFNMRINDFFFPQSYFLFS